MAFNFKKALLAGSAIVAVGALGAASANAQVLVANTNSGTAPAAVVAGAINMSTFNLTVNNTNNIVHGALTSTTGNLIITDSAAGALTSTVGSYTSSGAGAVTITNTAGFTGVVTANVTGALTTGTGNLTVTSQATAASDNTVLNVTGATVVGGALSVTNTGTAVASTISNAANFVGGLSVTGTTTLTSGLGAFANTAAITVGGNAAFTGAVTVTGGVDVLSPTALTLNGATNTFTGNLTLTNGTAGQARLVMSGTSAQTVTGNISGTGAVRVDNASGATFSGTVAAAAGVLIESAAANSSATFLNTVNAPITLGAAGTGTNTVNFDATTQGFTVTGAIAGAIAGETNIVNISNTSGAARTVTLATASTANLDQVNVSGTNTTATTGFNLTADAITVGAGSTLATTGGTLTGTNSLVNNGTLAMNGGAITSSTGGITGTGLLDVNNAGTVTGAITQGTADIAAVTLTHAAGTTAYNVGTTNFSAAGTLAVGAGSRTITGNFTNTTDGQGIVSVADGAGTTTIVGNLGASTANSLAAFNILGAAAQTVTTTGNLFVDAIGINDLDTLQFLGNSAQTVSGTITDGIILVGNGTTTSNVTFNGTGSSLASGTVALGSRATYNNNVSSTYTGAYTNTGATTVRQGSTLSADSFTNTGTYTIGVLDANGTLAATDFGRITDSSNGSVIGFDKLSINLVGDIGTGTAASVLTGNNTGAGTLADNSIQYTFVTANNGANTDIVVTRSTASSLAGSENTGVAATLDGLNASTNTQIAAIVDNLAAAPTREAFNNVLEAAGPTQDGGAIISGFTTSIQSIDVTTTRLASLRNGSGETAMTAGEMGNGLTGWIQGFGQQATQDARGGVKGYDADTYGIAVGLDTANAVEGGAVGVALSYGNTDVESDNSNRTQSDVDSYQVSLYGDVDVAPQTYIAGSLGFATNKIDQTRSNVGGVAGLTANADYDSQQYIAYAELGREYPMANKMTLTPKVLAHYQHIAIDSYTETGAGGANLNVSGDDLNILEFGVGAELAWDLDGNNGAKIRPALNAGYRYDVIGDEISSTSNFTGGGASFDTKGLDPADGTFNFGASLGYAMPNNWELSAEYNFDIKSDYDAHNGLLRASYKF